MGWWMLPMAISAAKEYQKGEEAKKQARISQAQAQEQNEYNSKLMRVSPWSGIVPSTTLQYGTQAPSEMSQWMDTAAGAQAGYNTADDLGLFKDPEKKAEIAKVQYDPGAEAIPLEGEDGFIGPARRPVVPREGQPGFIGPARHPRGYNGGMTEDEWAAGFTGPFGG